MNSFLQNLRFAARLTVRNPALAAICVLTLGVGIGLTATMFSIVHGALLKPLPFEESERLLAVVHTDVAQGTENLGIRLHDLEAYSVQQQVFEGLAAYGTGTFIVSGVEGAEQHFGAWMSANAFDLLRVRPILGRTFRQGEDAPGAAGVAVIGYRLWQDRYGSDPQVLGRTLRINGEEATIVGVMAEGFSFPHREQVWMPDRQEPAAFERGASPFRNLFGRLRPGVSPDQANAQLHAISQRLAASYPETNENLRAGAIPLREWFNRTLGGHTAPLLFVMLGGVFAVLLIACVNVANLLLGQAALRSREVAIRTALGASRLRIASQFLTEPLILAVAGSVIGLGLAYRLVHLFENTIPPAEMFFWMDFSLDATILLFVVGLTLFSTLASGLLPAIRASGGSVSETLKDESRGTSSLRGGRLTKGLVVAEVALSVVLLAGAGLMIRSVANVTTIDYPFATADVLTAGLALPIDDEERRYAAAADRIRFFKEVEARMAEQPGVRAVALTTALPGLGAGGNQFSLEGETYARQADQPFTRTAAITPGFFETFGAGILQGRAFGPEDREESLPVAIVNQSFARRHFPAGDALGSRVRLGGPDSEGPWRTIVGVVPDLHMSPLFGEDPAQAAGLYLPLAQTEVASVNIAARTAGPPAAVAPQLRSVVAAVDPDIPAYQVQSLAGALHENAWVFRVFGGIFVIMGVVALFLAAIGLYGVISFSVSRRTREMGVRMALGARAEQVTRLIVRQGVVQLAIGVVLGLFGALALTGLLRGVLYGVSPRDPLVFAAIVAVLALTGLVASWVPARRATRVDPMVALRGK
jgi:putative ABC transport system permease protein